MKGKTSMNLMDLAIKVITAPNTRTHRDKPLVTQADMRKHRYVTYTWVTAISR